MPSRRDDLIGLLLTLGIALGVVVLANLLPAAKTHGPDSAPTSPHHDPACAEWTDGCVVCQRGESGPACSMPGIACVPGTQQCLRRTGS
jgi:hypothetical protein